MTTPSKEDLEMLAKVCPEFFERWRVGGVLPAYYRYYPKEVDAIATRIVEMAKLLEEIMVAEGNGEIYHQTFGWERARKLYHRLLGGD